VATRPAGRLPRAALLACWLPALIDGRVSLDHALDAVLAADAAHDVAWLDGSSEPLALALGRLRSSAAGWTHVALPAPGDLTGLAGPPELNMDALAAGECVVLGGTGLAPAGLGLVPHRTGAGVVWRAHEAAEPPPYDLASARRTLRATLAACADTLADLDAARWSPELADALLDLRAPMSLNLPRGYDADAVALAATAVRCRTIVGLALRDAGGAATMAEADRRRAALRPLDAAAREALAAACSSPRRR
jgi:hypothetical protein